MMNILDEKLAEIRVAAHEQSNRIASELNSNVDTTNGDITRFNATMTTVAELRQKADALQASAIRDFNSSLTNTQAIQLGIIQQIADGQMVTGSSTPVVPTRKPKLVSGEKKDEAA